MCNQTNRVEQKKPYVFHSMPMVTLSTTLYVLFIIFDVSLTPYWINNIAQLNENDCVNELKKKKQHAYLRTFSQRLNKLKTLSISTDVNSCGRYDMHSYDNKMYVAIKTEG